MNDVGPGSQTTICTRKYDPRAALIDVEGSTRAIGVVRILLVCILWARFGHDFLLFRAHHPAQVLVSLVFFAATPFLLIGLFTRVAAFVTAGALLFMMVVLGHILGDHEYGHHHVVFLIVVTVALSFTPCGLSFSVDRWRAVRRARAEQRPLPREHGPLWGTRLLMMTVTSLYFFGAVDKMKWSYVSGARLHHHFIVHFPQHPLPLTDFAGTLVDVIFAALAASSVALELALSVGLYWARVRLPLMVAGAFFHLVIYVTLPVSTFSATTVLMYLVFLSPAAFHVFVDDVLGRSRKP